MQRLPVQILATVVAFVAGSGSTFAAPTAKPNILFLFADDQRADTIAALGNPVIKTPNLDRLAQRGRRLQPRLHAGRDERRHLRAVARDAAVRPVAVPHRREAAARRDVARGLRPGRLHHVHERQMAQRRSRRSPRSFQIARSVFAGGMTNPLKAKLSDLVDGKLTPPQLAPKHACEVFADEAIRFLREHQGGPFFCYVPFDAPHDPHIVPEDFPIRYDPAKIPLPPNFLPQHPWDNGEMTIRDEQLLPWPRTAGDGARDDRRILPLHLLSRRPDRPRARRAGSLAVREEHHRRFRRRLRRRPRQPRPDRQTELSTNTRCACR